MINTTRTGGRLKDNYIMKSVTALKRARGKPEIPGSPDFRPLLLRPHAARHARQVVQQEPFVTRCRSHAAFKAG